MSASKRESPSSNNSAAYIRTESPFSFNAGLIPGTVSDFRKSSHERVPDSQRVLSFFAPTDGIIWNVCWIMDATRIPHRTDNISVVRLITSLMLRTIMRYKDILPGIRITSDRCLVMDEGPTVVLGDLHLGYESALEQEGMYIPRINTDSIRDSLNDILYRYEPSRVVLLGDIKHDFRRSGFEEKREVRSIMNLLAEAAEVVAIKGNHDNYLQNIISDLGLLAVDYIDLMGFRLEHGHSDSGVRPVIIGHEHPSVRIPGSVGGGMKIQCFVHAERDGVIVLPPFSPFSSGNDLVLDKSCVMAPALKQSDYASARLYGVTEMGIMDLGTLRDLEDIRV